MSRTILRDEDDSWIRVPYQVKLGDEFVSMRKMMEDAVSESFGATSNKNIAKTFDNQFAVTEQYQRDILDKPYYRDTRVGGNDAINCIWQFCKDDDIVYDLTTTQKESGNGLGRVYATTTEKNQQICWFTFGVPFYTPMAAFYKNSFNDELIELNNTGNTSLTLGKIFGSAFSLLVFLPLLPIRLFGYLSKRTRSTYPINRFYELRSCMPLYYQYVDTILAQWLVDVGIYNNGSPDNEREKDNWVKTRQDSLKGANVSDLYNNNNVLHRSGSSWSANPDMVPDALKATGASIWDILKRRANVVWGADTSNEVLNSWDAKYEDLVKKFFQTDENGVYVNTKEKPNWWQDKYKELKSENIDYGDGSGGSFSSNPWVENADWETAFKSSALGATQFVGFRVDKSIDSSESFSNSTSPSSFAESFNSTVQEKQRLAIETGLKGANTGIAAFDAGINFTKNLLSTVFDKLKSIDVTGITDIASAAIGGAYIDIPEMYSGSSFSTSHSINLQLRSPYGDYISIYQSIIVPLALIMAGALPRAAGSESYVQPFLCRVYCKGMFSVPMGIIDSLSIKRGASEFGWTYNNLPTCVDVSISIKDMSPIMYLQINNEYFHGIFETDNAFREYMMTLSGLGLFERISMFSRIRRNIQFAAHRLRNQLFNSAFWTNQAAEFAPVRIVSAFVPLTTISRSK